MTLRSPNHDASEDQLQALRAFGSFLASRDDRVFVLSGAAGTGKTTLLDQMMARVEAMHRRPHLAALTGRAATVARLRAGRNASTLHGFLYRFDPRSSKVIDGVPRLVFRLRDPAEDLISVLFVDEASMLGSTTQGELETMQFGSGNLARDLLGHLFGQMERVGDTPKLVLIGDPYQLPPISDPDSVAFSAEGWEGLTAAALGQPLPTSRASLTTVHRQGEGGVLDLATRYRDALIAGDHRTTPRPSRNDPEVATEVSGGGSLSARAAEVAADPHSQVVVTYTNAGALAWNRRVRQERWGNADSPVRRGDVLVNTRRDPRTQFENGEILAVEWAAPSVMVISHLDRQVRLREAIVRAAGGDASHEVLVVDNALDSDERTLAREDLQVLWVDFTQRHRGLRESTPEFWDAAYRDAILNPLIAKYGYALTGHKAQGGQWDRVLVDFNKAPMAPDSEQAFRWTYTAITRARERLVLIDQPYRSPFSRLGTRALPAAGPGAEVPGVAISQTPEARRSRAELAVEAWARNRGFEVQLVQRKDYNTRFETSHDDESAVLDVFFRGDGLVSTVSEVHAGTNAHSDLVPPLSVIERASFEGTPRPSDERVDLALSEVERALARGGLTVFYRQEGPWSVELEVGDGQESGVLQLHFKKTGSFWRAKLEASARG